MSPTKGGCRACQRGNTAKLMRNQSLDTAEDEINVGQLGLKRQDSRMLASKLRYSVLKHIDSPEEPIGPTGGPAGNAGNTDCFNKLQYSILDSLEGDELDESLAQLSLEDLENIVTQENKDISCALTMARKNSIDVSSKPTQDENYNCRITPGDILSRVCDIEEDISPDVVAKMMYAAEIKSALTAPPQVIYNLLFDDGEYDPLPVNTAGHDTNLNDVVVPLGPPGNFKTDPDLEAAARINLNKTLTSPHPDDTSEGASQLHDQILNQVLSMADDTSEGTSQLHDQILNQVLSFNHHTETLEELLLGADQEPSCELFATLSDFNLIVESKEPEYQCYFQLRGSVPPSWFPEYYALFPDSPFKKFEKIEDPMSVMERAWENVQPASLKPTQGIHMIGL
ncbi:hypothetical protein M8J76_005797 [Diaphorina citri]|nr:hypothetical protein M8J75_008355 [Diaphorina citri]KAI5744844.1 hypothetical protein M8J76_005797 [Diaphorina citri]